MKLLIDMNLSPRWVDWLVDGGGEAVHWSTVGAYNAPDRDIMAYAKINDYVALAQMADELAQGALLTVDPYHRGSGFCRSGGAQRQALAIPSSSVSGQGMGAPHLD